MLTPSIPKIVLTHAAIQKALSLNGGDEGEAADELVEETFDVLAATEEGALPPGPAILELATGDDDRSDEGNFWGDRMADDFDEHDWEGIEDDLRRCVEEVAEDPTNVDPDAPSDPSETGGQAKRANYEFCPATHRLPIMRLFAKHASQHSLLPERHGQARSPAEIRRDAVTEMYFHCQANNLSEAWAYLWGSWYSPSRWKLWARSAYIASIPTKQTTMMVEALWRNLKRLVLHLYNRPPLDLAIYAIVTKSLPPYRHTLSQILGDARAGRAKSLTHFQQAFKRSWEKLRKVPIRGSYLTDLATFTCDCGAQKYHSYLLCKHLVHAAVTTCGPIPSSWWPDATRYHIPPFYTIPIAGRTPDAPESTQDHAWLRRMQKGKAIAATSKVGVDSEKEVIVIEDSESDTDIPEAPSTPARSSSPVSCLFFGRPWAHGYRCPFRLCLLQTRHPQPALMG